VFGLVWAMVFFLSALGTGRVFGHSLWVVTWPACFFLFVFAMRRFGQPIGSVVEAADRLAGGDYTARAPEYGPASVRSVGRAFNHMAARLQEQDRQRRNMTADIAHELRTPLTVIQGRLEGLLDGVYPRDEAQIRQVLDDTRTLSRLVDDLRTLANAESGTLSLSRESTDLAALAQDVIDTFSAEAARAGITLRVDAPRNLPAAMVDPLRIREVLGNLMSNSLRHTPSGGAVTIAIAVEGTRFLIKVVDTGEGMNPEEVARVFDRFYKGPSSHGSGLGLAIARNLVAAHGGEIRCESRPGKGTTFVITLEVRSAA
jgi:two-component system OmpR family sensor kinase/two-component system sensor histidine kinase BaeS